MSWRKKANPDQDYIKKGFANWLSQIAAMIMTKFFYVVAGRGAAKTTDLQAERLLEMVFDMPGAPVCWVSDTYTNLTKNVLPTILEALEAKGFKEGIHYVIGKQPPNYTEAEKRDVDPAYRKHFWKSLNKIVRFQHTIIFFTGFNITFGSLDRPASLAGRSYVHIFGDEVKYFKDSKIANLLKAVRGYKVAYGGSVFYRGHTFTTDMPDVSHIGEYDWILKQGKRMRKTGLMLVLQAAFVMNDALNELLAAIQSRKADDIASKKKVYERWNERWIKARLASDASTFFFIASSYVNVDILGLEWFDDSQNSELGDHNTAVLSMRAGLQDGDKFYANINENHFYMDGNDEYWSEAFGLQDEEDSRILKYLNHNKALDGGMDFGNMMSLTVAQHDGKKYYRALKFHYTLSPDWLPELAKEFRRFHAHQKVKVLNLHYDRAANNYAKAKQDLANQFKKAVEFEILPGETEPKPTGWKVILMSEGMGNIGQGEEYSFMQSLLANSNYKLPQIKIDFYHCKPLRLSLQMTKTAKNAKGQMTKDKRSEKLPIKRLPLESSNPSDSFKYLMMTKQNRRLAIATRRQDPGELNVRN